MQSSGWQQRLLCCIPVFRHIPLLFSSLTLSKNSRSFVFVWCFVDVWSVFWMYFYLYAMTCCLSSSLDGLMQRSRLMFVCSCTTVIDSIHLLLLLFFSSVNVSFRRRTTHSSLSSLWMVSAFALLLFCISNDFYFVFFFSFHCILFLLLHSRNARTHRGVVSRFYFVVMMIIEEPEKKKPQYDERALPLLSDQSERWQWL